MPPETLPDDWLDFYMWAIGEAEKASEDAPQTQLINEQGTIIHE